MGLFITNNIASKFIKVKESEKAVAFKGWANFQGSKKTFEIAVWFPKSIIKNDMIPDWFLNRKSSDYEYDGLEVVLELA